jgi:hypothetical protein
MWRGSDCLHRMCNDLDFLASCQPLGPRRWWVRRWVLCTGCCVVGPSTSASASALAHGVALGAYAPVLVAVSPSILFANPFNMPQNLAHRVVAVAKGATATVSSSEPVNVRDAENGLLQTSVSADVRIGGGAQHARPRPYDDHRPRRR